MSNTLSDLLKRVEAASGPDRLLDADLCCTFHLKGLRPARPDDFDGKYGYSPGNLKTEHGFLQADSYTRSLDSALSLVERMLPGWSLSLSVNAADDHRVAIKHAPSMFEIGPCWVHSGKTPALALLSALLSALIAQDRT